MRSLSHCNLISKQSVMAQAQRIEKGRVDSRVRLITRHKHYSQDPRRIY